MLIFLFLFSIINNVQRKGWLCIVLWTLNSVAGVEHGFFEKVNVNLWRRRREIFSGQLLPERDFWWKLIMDKSKSSKISVKEPRIWTTRKGHWKNVNNFPNLFLWQNQNSEQRQRQSTAISWSIVKPDHRQKSQQHKQTN